MKKQVLSALAFCSALGIAQAQTDVTKEYLVNPSFETLKSCGRNNRRDGKDHA